MPSTDAKTLLKQNSRAVYRDERGQDLTEYGLLLLLIAIGALVVLEALGVEIVEVWEATKNILPSV